jgi:hypothetical protein
VSAGPEHRFFDRRVARDHAGGKISGPMGEELVTRELNRLDRSWVVLPGDEVGVAADVDHLVIGPAGVFCLQVQRISFEADVVVAPRQLRVDGRGRDLYPRVVHASSLTEAELHATAGVPVKVQPVLVMVGLDRLRMVVEGEPDHVAVVTRKRLARWLRGQARVLDAAQVVRLASAIVGRADLERTT